MGLGQNFYLLKFLCRGLGLPQLRTPLILSTLIGLNHTDIKVQNLVHISYEAGILEDPETTPPKELWLRTIDPRDAADEPVEFSIHFEKGVISKVVIGQKEITDSVESFKALNKIGSDAGVGRVDIVENRFIGLKVSLSRGLFRLCVIRDVLVTYPEIQMSKVSHLWYLTWQLSTLDHVSLGYSSYPSVD